MDVEQFKDDVRRGRIDADRLVDLVVTLQRGLQQAKQQLDQAKQQLDQTKRRIEELEEKLGGSPTVKIAEPFSVRAARTEKVFPPGVPENDCKLSHTRPVWRLEATEAAERLARMKAEGGSFTTALRSTDFGSVVLGCFPERWATAPCLRRKRAASKSSSPSRIWLMSSGCRSTKFACC